MGSHAAKAILSRTSISRIGQDGAGVGASVGAAYSRLCIHGDGICIGVDAVVVIGAGVATAYNGAGVGIGVGLHMSTSSSVTSLQT